MQFEINGALFQCMYFLSILNKEYFFDLKLEIEMSVIIK